MAGLNHAKTLPATGRVHNRRELSNLVIGSGVEISFGWTRDSREDLMNLACLAQRRRAVFLFFVGNFIGKESELYRIPRCVEKYESVNEEPSKLRLRPISEGLIARLIRNSFRECRSIISRRRHKAAAYMAELPAFCRVLGGVPEAAGAANNRFIDSESRGTTLSLLYDTNTRVGNDLWSDDGAARRPATPRNTRSRNEAFIRAKWRSKVPAEHESAENTSRHRGKRSRIERKSKSDRAIESQQARSIDFLHLFLSLSLSLSLCLAIRHAGNSRETEKTAASRGIRR